MDKKLLRYFSKIMPLTNEESNAIAEGMTVQQYKKGTILLREGQMSAGTYFVLDGCVRQYYLIDGEEKTKNFFTEEQFVISIKSTSQNVPSTHYLECSEDCTLLVGNRNKEDGLYKRFPRLEEVSRKIMLKTFEKQQHEMAAYLTDTPQQRYLKLLESRPELIQRIPQYQLASYIGVKAESLSRIKKRIATNK